MDHSTSLWFTERVGAGHDGLIVVIATTTLSKRNAVLILSSPYIALVNKIASKTFLWKALNMWIMLRRKPRRESGIV